MLQDSPMYAYLPAKDVQRAKAFYERKVGLKAKEERNGWVVATGGGARAAWFKDSEGNILALIQSLGR